MGATRRSQGPRRAAFPDRNHERIDPTHSLLATVGLTAWASCTLLGAAFAQQTFNNEAQFLAALQSHTRINLDTDASGDPIPDNTPLDQQYSSLGVDFDEVEGLDGPRTTSEYHYSPPNGGKCTLTSGGGGGFLVRWTTSPTRAVGFTLWDLQLLLPSRASLYDIYGMPIRTYTIQDVSGTATLGFVFFGVLSPTPIAKIKIQFGQNDFVVFDDLLFGEPKLSDRTGTWRPEAPMNRSRQSFAAIEFGECIIIFGGDDHTCPNGPTQVPEVERFDGTEWTIVDFMPNGGRSGLQAVVLDGSIYLLGGYIPGGDSSAEVWRYEPCSSTWSKRASMPGERAESRAAVARDGKIVLIGGRSWDPGWNYYNTVFIYDPTLDSWSEGVPHPGRLRTGDPLGLTSGIGAAGRIFILGGISSTDTYNEIWRYDPFATRVLEAWNLVGSMPERLSGAFVETFGNTVAVVGGLERWDGSTYPANDEIHVFDLQPPDIQYAKSIRMPDFPSQCAVLDGRLYLIGTNDGYGAPCAAPDCWSIALE